MGEPDSLLATRAIAAAPAGPKENYPAPPPAPLRLAWPGLAWPGLASGRLPDQS
jgi:hypothetical protein